MHVVLQMIALFSSLLAEENVSEKFFMNYSFSPDCI